MLHTQLAAFALAAITLAASGCGGSSKAASSTAASATKTSATTATETTATTPTTPAPTSTSTNSQVAKAEAAFIARGDAICARLNTKLDAPTVKSVKDFARVLPEAAGYEQAAFTELSKLVPPASMANDWEQILANTKQWAENSSKLAEYARANKFNSAKALILATGKIHEHLAKVAKRNGFKQCSIV